MSTFNNILQRWGLSLQSGARLTNSRVGNLVCCATILAGLALCGGAKAQTNVLVNPGAETGDFTGWTPEYAVGYIHVVSTNGTIPNSSGSNFLAHSGQYTFQMFNTTGDSVELYQDVATIAGAQFQASCWAICYASNYFQAGANAHMEIVFYDTNNNVVPYPPSTSYGVLATDFLDPVDYTGFGITWTIIPPPAVDASGWVYLQATNLDKATPATENDDAATGETFTLTAPTNTAYVRYMLAFTNTADFGGDVYFDDCVLNKLAPTDPDIVIGPTALTVYKGAGAQLSVVASHTFAYPSEKFHYQWQYNGTNLPAAGGNDIQSGVTAAALVFTNLQPADSGMYAVWVTLTSTAGNYTNSIRSVPVPLTVVALSPLQKANALGVNSGFESNPIWPPWEPFNGAYFATAANVYGASTTPVNVFDGNSCALVGANGDRDSGFHHPFPVTPGTFWKAGGYAYISSTNGNDYVGGNTIRLQCWFVDNTEVTVPGTPTYESFKIYGAAYTNTDMVYMIIDTSSPYLSNTVSHVMPPKDQWFWVQVTNEVNNGGIGLEDDLPWNTTPGYFMVPTNASVADIEFQVYQYCPGGPGIVDTNADGSPSYPGGYLGVGADAVYWDDMELIQVLPVTNLTASASSGNINLSFNAGAGLNYAIQYKTNLTDATWNTLTVTSAPMSWQTNINAATTFYPLTVSDTLQAAKRRFYRVQSE